MSRYDAERLIGFVMHVMTRRAQTTVRDLMQDTGYSRATVYRHLRRLQAHAPIDIEEGVVTVRRPIAGSTSDAG